MLEVMQSIQKQGQDTVITFFPDGSGDIKQDGEVERSFGSPEVAFMLLRKLKDNGFMP